MALVIAPCRALCSWSRVEAELFACAGCGSQWAPDQAWTPRQADGTVPEDVRAARVAVTLPEDVRGAQVSGGCAGGAGSAGS